MAGRLYDAACIFLEFGCELLQVATFRMYRFGLKDSGLGSRVWGLGFRLGGLFRTCAYTKGVVKIDLAEINTI